MFLIEELVKQGKLQKKEAISLKQEIKELGKKEEEILLKHKIVSELELFNLKSEIMNIPLKTIEVESISREALLSIPKETAVYYNMVPLEKRDKVLEVGMIYPEDFKAQEALKFLARQQSLTSSVFLITPSMFKLALKQYQTLEREVKSALKQLGDELGTKEEINLESKTANEIARLVEKAPVTKIVAVILKHAVEGKASDIHIEPLKDKIRVRFRLFGKLYPSIFLPTKIHLAVMARIKILSQLKIDETRIPQDGRFSAQISGRQVDFRISTFPTTLGEKIVIRVLDPTFGVKTLEEVGLSGRNLKLVEKVIKKPDGLILATGPTGSGKTTTLYTILRILNNKGVNISSLEDPVEYFIDGVNQSQIKPGINYSFARGLRHLVRQDPDIILVGEIRDEETASLVIHAALTGHLVLSTLHTTNAAGTIIRLIDLGIKPYLISSTLKISIAQRLVKKLCSHCSKEVKPKPEIKNMILEEIKSLPLGSRNELELENNFSVFEPQGCKKCGQTGFSGRIGLLEVLEMTDPISELISEEHSERIIIKQALKDGMITIKQDGILKVLKGLTTIKEVLKVTG